MVDVKFAGGFIVTTLGIKELIDSDSLIIIRIHDCMAKHFSGDWGNLSDEDKSANDAALLNGGRILSQYQIDNAKIWIITEADRTATTILLPSEY